uniref:SPATA31 domain-containing protein n=1 Tax=Otolemur garnettii TaxID=30611 RepID=H0XYK3_OTOGA
MDAVLHFLSSAMEAGQSFGSALLHVYPQLTLLVGLGVLVGYMWRQMMLSQLSTTWDSRDIYKHQEAATRRQKPGTPGERNIIQGGGREDKKLISRLISFVPPIFRSPSGEDRDTIPFRLPLFNTYHEKPKDIMNVLLRKSREDPNLSMSSSDSEHSHTHSSYSLDSTCSESTSGDLMSAPPLDPSPPPPSSPDPMTLFPNSPSPPSLADYLPPDPVPVLHSKFPMDHSPSQPLAFAPPTPQHSEGAGPGPPPEAPVTIKTIFAFDPILLQDVDSSPNSAQTTDPTGSYLRHHTPLNLSPFDAKQELHVPHPSVTSLMGEHETGGAERGNLTLSNPEAVALLEKYVKKNGDFLLRKEKKNKTRPSSFDAKEELHVLHPSVASLMREPETTVVQHGKLILSNPDAVALLERNIKRKSDFLLCKRNIKKKGDFLLCKEKKNRTRSLLFGVKQELHLPHPSVASLMGETEVNVVQRGNLSPFNPEAVAILEKNLKKKSDSLLCKVKENTNQSFSEQRKPNYLLTPSANMSASVADEHASAVPLPLCSNKDRAQELNLHQQPPHSKTLEVTQGQSHTQLPSPLPIPSPEPLSQMRLHGMCIHTPQKEAQCLMPSQIHHQEWNVLQKEQEVQCTLPSMVKKSQADLCPPATNITLASQSSRAYVPISVLPGDFPLHSELQKKLEHHLQKRLIQHQCGLPRRVLESVSPVHPQRGPPETSKSKCPYGLSWISFYKNQSSEDPQSLGLSHSQSSHKKCSEMFLRNKDVRTDQGRSLENGSKDHLLTDPDRSSGKGLGSNTGHLFGSNSRASSLSLGLKVENGLRVQENKMFEDISEATIPETVYNSQYPTKHTVPFPEKSHSQTKHRNLAPLVSRDTCPNPSQEVCFLGSRQKEKLEAQTKCYHMKTMQGLPS